jgi:1-deoxy-D-xylulose-5-phosphate synthase
MDGPILIHVHTTKGKGYGPAEMEPDKFHGIGKFDRETGKCPPKTGAPSYTSVFSKALIELAAKNSNITAITAAMPSGTGLKAFGEEYPNRFFDVGIAEEHAVTLAAGMAADGKHPVVALYSTFAQRGYDQLMHDVCLQNLPVTLCLDRAGLVGADGPTHHGAFDLSYLRHMPNMTVFVPRDEAELRDMLATAVKMDSPTAVRYPRGAGKGVELASDFADIPLGKSVLLREGSDVAILGVGPLLYKSEAAADILQQQGISAAVVNMRFVKPLDTEMIKRLSHVKLMVTVEENSIVGGFGSAVAEFLMDSGLGRNVDLLRLGLPDKFIEQGTQEELLALCGLQPEQMAERIKERLN